MWTTPPTPALQSFLYDHDGTSILNQLRSAELHDLNGIEALRLDDTVNFLPRACIGSTLYIRNFYSELFEILLNAESNCILTGNLGISKCWFQMYILYRLVKEPVFTVVIRQRGRRVTLFDLEGIQAFSTSIERCSDIFFGFKNVYISWNLTIHPMFNQLDPH